MRSDCFEDCFSPPRDPWYVRLIRWFFPIKVPMFTSVTVPACFHTHTKREDLAKLMTETQPMSKPDA